MVVSTVEWLDDKMGLLSWSFDGGTTTSTLQRGCHGRNAGNRSTPAPGPHRYLKDRAKQSKELPRATELDSAIGPVRLSNSFARFAPLYGILDTGGSSRVSVYGVLMPMGRVERRSDRAAE